MEKKTLANSVYYRGFRNTYLLSYIALQPGSQINTGSLSKAKRLLVHDQQPCLRVGFHCSVISHGYVTKKYKVRDMWKTLFPGGKESKLQ